MKVYKTYQLTPEEIKIVVTEEASTQESIPQNSGPHRNKLTERNLYLKGIQKE